MIHIILSYFKVEYINEYKFRFTDLGLSKSLYTNTGNYYYTIFNYRTHIDSVTY